MATAKEKLVGRVYEQIPHDKRQYAYLALEASNVVEFEKLKEEAANSPALAHYAHILRASVKPKLTVVPDVEESDSGDAASKLSDESGDTPQPDDATAGAGSDSSTPTLTPAQKAKLLAGSKAEPQASIAGKSAREIARERMLAKKGEK
jgi:hypothetical protein